MNILLRRIFTRVVFTSILISSSPSDALIFGRVIVPIALGAGGYLGVKYGPAFIRLNSYYDISEYITQKRTESWYSQTRDLNESLLHDFKSTYGNASIAALPQAWLINAAFAFFADACTTGQLIKSLENDSGVSLSLPSLAPESSQSDWKTVLLGDLHKLSVSADRYLMFIKEQPEYKEQKDQYFDEYVARIAYEVAMVKNNHLRQQILNFCKRIFNWDFINSFTKE